MKALIPLILAAALLIAGAVIIFKNQGSPSDEKAKTSTVHSPSSTSSSSRPTSSSSEKSFRYLKNFSSLPIGDAPGFAQLQARTSDLTIEQIQALLAGNTSHKGLSGWLRAALWGELGRRDHRESFESLLATLNNLEKTSANFENDQAVFSFLRGRADSLTAFDSSVDSVIADFEKLSSTENKGYWVSSSLSHLFSKLANLDHQATWKLIQNHPANPEPKDGKPNLMPNKSSAKLAGFFRALPTEELVSSYLNKWQPALEKAEAKKAYETYQTQINSRLSGVVLVPAEEEILKYAVASLARFNPEAALEWLSSNQPDTEKPDYNRIHGVWREMASRYPEEALEIFAREEFVDARRSNASALIFYDFSRAPEIIQETGKASHQTQILNNTIHSAASTHVKDFFPTLEGPNRLPNFQDRYDSLLEAINLGTFPERQREIFIKTLDRVFQKKQEEK